ncbi:MAG: NnrU family protein [Acetobacteraceae bacterium]
MLALALAGLFFIAVHIGVAGTMLRDRLVAMLGTRGYMVAFSIASVAGLIWLISAYNRADYVPLWGIPEWWKPAAIVLMLPAWVLVVVGLATPNPTAVAAERLVDQPARGIVRVTRHPFLVGVALWAAVHLIANGDLASVLFFGTMLVVALAGPASIDAKRRRALGPARWDAFAGQTSILPFGAIAAGRNTWSLGEIGAWRVLAGVVAYALFLGGHAHIVGVSPFPHW